MPVDFFVSYASADRPWAEWIAWVLEEAGYCTRVQAWDFGPGANWVVEMDEAADVSARTILVLSPASLESPYVRAEWAAAFRDDPEGKRRKLLPVRVRDCRPRGLLGTIVYLDLVGLAKEIARERLLSAAALAPGKPTQHPEFPGAHSGAAAARAFPSGGPPIWNVPAAAGRFVGREGVLQRLAEGLAAGDAAAVTQAQAISGLGGVGKTRLAAEFARRHRNDYDVVWWVRAEDAVSMLADYAGLAEALGLPERDEIEQKVRAAGVKAWLEGHDRWLLIFDNAPGPDAVHDLMPTGSRGHLLITSRRHGGWRGLAGMCPIDVWARTESMAFLHQRSGDNDAGAADAIADALGDLPLALEQAGAYVDNTGLSLAGFQRRLASHAPALFARGRPADYEHTVATTWELAFAEVERDRGCAALLFCSAFLASEQIPRELFASESIADGVFASAAGELVLDEAVRGLLAFSLVTVDEMSMGMHRLVQQVILERLSEHRGHWLQIAQRLVLDAFPAEGEDAQTWAVCERLLPHVLAVCDHADAETTDTAKLLAHAARYLHARVELVLATALYQRALHIFAEACGPDHVFVAVTLSNLGLVRRQRGEFEAARDHLEHALHVFEAAYGPAHPTVAGTRSNLGNLLRHLGQLEAAREQLQGALQVFIAAYGPAHPEVGRALGNIGLVLYELGEPAAAREHHERALHIMEAAYGPAHPEVARARSYLGLAAQELGDLEGALEHQQRAAHDLEAAYGPDHPEVAHMLRNLGGALQRIGQLEAARQHLQRALQIFESAYDRDHRDVARTRNDLAALVDRAT